MTPSTPRGAVRAAASVVLLLVVLLSSVADAQDGRYLRHFAGPPLRGPKPLAIVQVDDMKTKWITGQTKLFAPITSICMEYRVSLTLNSDFVSVTITNPNVCLRPDCKAKPDYDPCIKPVWLDQAVVCPFALEWVDRSTSAVYTLPTRQNVPTNIAMEPLSITVPQALDRSLITDSMELRVTILCRETNLMETSIPQWFYPDVTSLDGSKEYRAVFDRSSAQRILGIQFYSRVVSTGNYEVYIYFRRKQPTPPLVHKIMFGSGCEYNYVSLGGAVINNCQWFSNFYTFPSVQRNWVYIHQTCTYMTCANSWAYPYSSTSQLVWEYYEDYRQHKSNITLNFNTLVATTKNPATGYSVTYTPTNGEYAMKFRFTWRDVIEDTTGYSAGTVDSFAYNYFLGLYLVPPFAVQDVWVTVHNELGNRMFSEIEKRVPYRKGLGDGPGQLGWPTALNNYYTGVGSYSLVNVMVRYNRQSKLGDTEEEKRAALLRGFVEDNDGDVTQIVSPIPKSILSESGVMGAVAANAIPAGKQFGSSRGSRA
jgi:hypothetical protein